jgi:hypothetical protein
MGGLIPDGHGKELPKNPGAHQLWQLKAYLDEPAEKDQIENRRKVG